MTKKAKPPVVTACAAAGENPPLDRPEWLIGSTSAKLIHDVIAALIAPLKVPKGDILDLTVDGTDVRFILLPAYETGPYETWNKRSSAWISARKPLHEARKTRIVGGIKIVPVPANLDPPGDEVSAMGGWLRMISKKLPGYIEPRGYLHVVTTKTKFPEKMSRGRSYWTVYQSIRLVLSTGRGKNEFWQQVLEVARAP